MFDLALFLLNPVIIRASVLFFSAIVCFVFSVLTVKNHHVLVTTDTRFAPRSQGPSSSPPKERETLGTRLVMTNLSTPFLMFSAFLFFSFQT